VQGETSREQSPFSLTRRQLDVLRLLERRLSHQEIAEQLCISPNTVKRHTATIYRKVAVHSRRQAVAAARWV